MQRERQQCNNATQTPQRSAHTAHSRSLRPRATRVIHAACPAMRSMRHLQESTPHALLEFCVHKRTRAFSRYTHHKDHSAATSSSSGTPSFVSSPESRPPSRYIEKVMMPTSSRQLRHKNACMAASVLKRFAKFLISASDRLSAPSKLITCLWMSSICCRWA
jgi:hypothetical protein